MHARPAPWPTLLTVAVISTVFLSACQQKEHVRMAAPTNVSGPAVVTRSWTNRLIREKSPYLLQHAHNPVDWYPWGEEAFAKARRENKPIFVSIGYSTCHWCHVMERESFENPQTAVLMNEHFVNIKVDREERPDIDGVYMSFVQATTGHGGWPMSVWLTPELKPFVGGTYFPPDTKFGRPGFPAVLQQIAQAWREKQPDILASSAQIILQLKKGKEAAEPATQELGRAVLDEAYAWLKTNYEPRQGGFGDAPKFPRPVSLNFLLRYYDHTTNATAREMVLFTLRKMAEGGMHDQLGGGFHRYSVDARWHVPHFEKMLYDQAQLAIAYLEAFQVSGDPFYAGIAKDIFRYVQRDLTGPDGQLYSAEDADSPVPGHPTEKAEGAFYVWEQAEIQSALSAEAAEIFSYYYGVAKDGNAASDPQGEFRQKNILFVAHSLDDTAKKFKRAPEEVAKVLSHARMMLFSRRQMRPRPHLDDKSITAWNGLMISAFARGAQILDDAEYRRMASKAASFVQSHLFDPGNGRLLRRYRDGEAAVPGFAEDYAFVIQGLLDLYEASFDVSHLRWAIALQEKQNELFWDAQRGGYFSTAGTDPSVLLRMKEDYDGAEPSPNSIAALNLSRLAEMLDRNGWRELARRTLGAFSSQMVQSPSALPQMLVALDFELRKPVQVVMAGQRESPSTSDLLKALHGRFVPNKILLLADGGESQEFLSSHLEFLKAIKPLDGQTTVFVCRDYVCQLPTTNKTVMLELVNSPGDH